MVKRKRGGGTVDDKTAEGATCSIGIAGIGCVSCPATLMGTGCDLLACGLQSATNCNLLSVGGSKLTKKHSLNDLPPCSQHDSTAHCLVIESLQLLLQLDNSTRHTEHQMGEVWFIPVDDFIRSATT